MIKPRFRYFLNVKEIISDLMSLLGVFKVSKESKSNFENELKGLFGKSYCNTFSSYRTGLYFYLNALDLPQGTPVFCTPITIPDVFNVINILGLKPVLVDMCEDTHNFNLDSLLTKMENINQGVILITYLSGMNFDKGRLREAIKDKEIVVIEDISQTYSSELENSFYFGNCLIGSLSSGKVLSTYTGGFLLQDDSLLYQRIGELSADLPAAPRRRFLFELYTNLKIVLLTSKIGFFFVSRVFYLIWTISPRSMANIGKSNLGTRNKNLDVFFDDIPEVRSGIPNSWKTSLDNWQSQVGLRFIKNMEKRTLKRMHLGQVFLSNLSENVKNRIPKACFENSFCFYHLPIKHPDKVSRQSFLRQLFFQGIDSEGYGLNLCNEEKALSSIIPNIDEPFPISHKVKYSHVFIPIHESFSEKDIIKMAKNLNRLFLKYES